MATLTGKKLKNWYKSLLHFEDEQPATGTKKVVQDGDGNALPIKISTGAVEFTGTVEGIEKADVGLSNVDNTADADKPVSTLQAAADLAAENNAKAYADTLVVGLVDDRGNYDASGNVFPSSGGSGSAGAIKKGDLWTLSVAGTLGGTAVTAGDLVRALVDTPGQTSSNWAVTENNIGYVAENSTNKDATGGYVGLTGFKIKIKNAAGTVTSLISSLASTAREWVLPDKSMTIAGLDDTTLSADASGTDTYTATISPAITAYSSTQRFYIKFPNANTGAATLNLNGLGAKTIKKNGNTDLAATDIKTGQIYCIAYDGTNFQLLTWIGAAGGGGDMLAANNLSEVNPALAKANLSLNNVDNTSDVNKPVSTAQAAADLAAENAAKAYADTKIASTITNGDTTHAPDGNSVYDALIVAENNAKAYADTLVVGLIDDRGNYDASGNVFPSSGGSGTAGAIKKGDLFTVSASGTLGGTAVTAGDLVRALVDTPGQTSSNWAVTENNIGYVAENSSNKDANGGYVGLTGFKIKIKNAAGTVTSLISSLASTAREWVLPDKNMTIAGLDDTTLSADASGTNTYTATISPAITAYASSQRFYIKFTNANTGAATLNLNALGAIAIRKNGNQVLAPNDIKANQIYLIGYDGTNFQLLAWVGSEAAITACFDGGGSAIANGSTFYITCPFAAKIVGYSIVADTGTVTFKTWKIATGTALPTVSNSISTSGVSLSSGNVVSSAVVTDFTSVDIATGDIIAFNITAISAATKLTLQLIINK